MSCHSSQCFVHFCHIFLRYRDLDGGGPQVNEHRNITHHDAIPSEPSDIGQATLVTTSPGVVADIISFFFSFFYIWRGLGANQSDSFRLKT